MLQSAVWVAATAPESVARTVCLWYANVKEELVHGFTTGLDQDTQVCFSNFVRYFLFGRP